MRCSRKNRGQGLGHGFRHKFALIFLFVFCVLLTVTSSFASGAHESGHASLQFRLDIANVIMEVAPATYVKGKAPDVTLELTNYMTGTPVLDAEIYILLERTGKEDIHSAHTGHTMPKPSTENIAADDGLDFGESPQMTTGTDLGMFKKLQPQQKAGTYAVSYPLPDKGEYAFTIALKALDGRKFAEPLVYGGSFVYKKASKARQYNMLFIMGIILFSGLTGAWILAKRKALNISIGQKMNILDIPSVKRFLKSSWFQPLFQIPMLVFFIIIIIAGLFDVQMGDRNIATLLMWTVWWAGIIFTFVFFGRIWCMMCPYGALQDWIQRVFTFNKDFPKPVRNVWLSSFLFFGLTWWDSYSGIVNKPALTAYILLGLFVTAVGIAVIYKGRAFCRYVCPIGGLIGIYSMFSPVELRNKCLDVCRRHKVRECIKGTEHSYPCPMFQTPMTLDRNNYCNFCSECIKSCSQDNIVIRFRSFAKDLWFAAKGYMDEAYLAMTLVGITIVLTGEMVGPWHRWMDALGGLLPFSALGIASHASIEKITSLTALTIGSLIVPSLLLAVTAMIVRRATAPGPPLSFKETFVQFAYMFIPVGLSMHLAHNISHLFKEGPQIVPAVQRTLNEYTGMDLGEPDWSVTPLLGDESIFWLQMATFIVLNIFSLYAGYRIAVRYYNEKALKAFLPMAALAVILMIVNVFILGQPMSARHTH
ncbi:MAG: 4Fe-4S binding protein [Nitrospiraceae bacterium]|nr:MAG: 4Fe-4S binding protein [Nitrospiraceae bacterium]